jgi:hypothetical protein
MKKLWTWFKSLNLIVQIGIVIGLFIAGRYVWKWAKKQFRTKGQIMELTDITTQISNLQGQGQKASFPSSQYSTWANQLAEAFNGCGTSDQAWRGIFTSIKNDLDLALLIEAYGVREFDECNWEFNFGDFKGTLSEALVHELDGDELIEVNDLLKSKGIKSSF